MLKVHPNNEENANYGLENSDEVEEDDVNISPGNETPEHHFSDNSDTANDSNDNTIHTSTSAGDVSITSTSTGDVSIISTSAGDVSITNSSNKSNGDGDEEEDVEENNEQQTWKTIINIILESEADLTDNDGNIKLSKVANEIKTSIQWHINIAASIRGTDVFKQIQKTTKKLEKQGYEPDEAVDAAWKMRKYLIKKEIVQPNLELIITALEEEGDDVDMEKSTSF